MKRKLKYKNKKRFSEYEIIMRYEFKRSTRPRALEKYAKFIYWDSSYVYGTTKNYRPRNYCMVRHIRYSMVRESRVQGIWDGSRSFTPQAWNDQCPGRKFTADMVCGMADSIRVKIHEKKNQTSW